MTRRWRLFPKYALLIIALVAGMVLASGAVSIYFSHRENQDHLVALQNEKAQNAANRIEQYVTGIEHQLSWTALPRIDGSGGGDALEARRIEYLKLLRQVPAITEVVWIDPTGREQLRISRLAMDTRDSGADFSQEPKFVQANAGKTYYGQVYFRRGTEPYLTIARPAGSGGGVTAAEVNLKFVWEVVSRIRIGEKGLAYVIDAGGTLIAHPDISLVLKKTDLRALPQVAAVVAPDGHALGAARDVRGEPVFAAFARIPTLAWTVFVESPRAEAYAPLYATLQRMGLVLVVALLISITASYLLARALVRPLRALQQGAAQIGAGELDRHIEVRTGDELEGLAEQFNKMSAELKESYADLERKVEERTAELRESLDRQTATADILRVIAGSMSDVQPVLDAIVRSAAQLFGRRAAIRLVDGDMLRRQATSDVTPRGFHGEEALPIDRDSLVGAVALDGKAQQVEDTHAREAPAYARAHAGELSYRAIATAPLTRDGTVLGVLSVSSPEPGLLSDKQMALLKTFTDQAVIAIQNARLFNETQEALETQTATADILKVISESPTDVQPVFDAIAERAKTLCDAIIGAVTRFDGEWVRFAAVRGASPQAIAALRDAFPMRPSDAAIMARAIRDHAPVQIHDVLLDPAYGLKEAAQQAAFRSAMAVPMLKEGQVLGSIAVCRAEAGAFPDKQLKLLQTFADQAVIAIENVRLFNETKEALERQTATAEVLNVISQSMVDTQPVFDAIVRSCRRLFRGRSVILVLPEGALLKRVAIDSDGTLATEGLWEWPLDRETVSGDCVLSSKVIVVRDSGDVAAQYPRTAELASASHWVSGLFTPLLREGRAIGCIGVLRPTAGTFDDKEVALAQTFADQAVIAIENVRLFNETKEALEQQTATAEILQVISSSLTDVQPVFDAIAERARLLCEATVSGVTRFDGELVHLVAFHGASPEASAAMLASFPMRPGRGAITARAIAERAPVQIADVLADPDYALKEATRLAGYRSNLAVPMLREGQVVGSIGVCRSEPGVFPDKQVKLLQTFADQAVIAIENVRLFNETREALERQTATAEILKVISGSPGDVQPVLDIVAERSGLLCRAEGSQVWLVQGGLLRAMTSYGPGYSSGTAVDTLPLRPTSVAGRAVIERACVHVEDIVPLIDTEYPAIREMQARYGFRTVLAVPMLREGEAVGVIALLRNHGRAFTPAEISLAKTFADQAVIAIENVRLFNETKEALERQTATAEILRVISGSVTDTQPVFDAIVRSCHRLFTDARVALIQPEGNELVSRARAGREAPLDANQLLRWPIDRASAAACCILDSRMISVPDLDTAAETYPRIRQLGLAMGFGSALFVPLLRDAKAIGCLSILRVQKGEFDAKEVSLAQTFADQAVIAIENVRLFNETKEALERQTATAEILKVISESPTDVQPVFDVIAGRAARLTGADYGWVFRFDSELIHIVSSFGVSAEGIEATRQAYPMPPSGGSATARAVREEAVINYADVLAEKDAHDKVKAIRRQSGYRSVLAVPMRRDDRIVGVITVAGAAVGQFGDKEIDLLQTFARQAVIAIENARLFNETKEALEQQTATAEILEVISNSVSDTQPVFDKIMDSCQRLFGTSEIGIRLVGEDGQLHLGSHRGSALETLRKQLPRPLDQTAAGLAIREQRVLHYPDVLGASDVPELLRRVAHEADNFSIIMAPMVWKERGIGTINVVRRPPAAFSDKEMSLLKTFADQAVIAIQNARLFNETKDALERQTATAEILRVISGSPTDVHPVLVAVAERAALLCDAVHSSVLLVDGEVLRQMAVWSREPGAAGPIEGHGVPIRRSLVNGRAFIERRTVHVEDIEPLLDTEYPDARASFERIGFHAMLAVPMLREGQAIGTIFIWRREVRRFSSEQIALVETFASQAVIAIENVRLFNETKEALEHQTATAEILKVISSSVADTRPVFDKIMQSCQRLFEGTRVGINLVGPDGMINMAAYAGPGRDEFEAMFPIPLSGDSGTGSAIRERRVMHYPDIEGAHDVPLYVRRGADITGTKSVIFAPMLWEEQAIGAILVARNLIAPFSEKEIALLKTFADQAVIAIQNARLFHEIQDKSQQLEQANKHKSEFLANMSHELRTPLNAIIGFSEVLTEQMFGEVNDKQLEYLHDIHSSGQHLLTLINDVLDLSKIEAGRMELELSCFDLGLLLDNSLTLVRERAQRHGLSVTLQMGDGLEEWVADARKVKQVVVNLLSNAVKFTPTGGTVSLCARRVEVGDSVAAQISVADTGVGIAPEEQALVFEEFRQASGDYLRKTEGTGLGLSLAKRFVELHGGTIRLDSRPGAGATFTVTLPLQPLEAIS